MRKISETIRKYITQRLMPDDIAVTHRLCNLIYASTLIGSYGTLIISLILTPSPLTILTICAAIVVVSVSLYLSVYKRKHMLAALIIILFIDEAIFPIMYFVNGGIHSGMQLWFILGLIFGFLVLDGKLCVFIFLLGSVTLGSCFVLEEKGIIPTVPLEGTVWTLDVIQSMIFVALIFGVFFKLQTYIYTKQNNALLDKEKELIEAMKEVEAANNAKSEFLANMSHEIRTPINAIMGINEIILRDCKEEETLENSGRIQAASNNLLSLINDILDFSKIESGKMEILCEDYTLLSVLNDCYNMIYLRAQNKGLELKVVTDPLTPDNLNGDRFHIYQVISNLLTNAVKYTSAGKVELLVRYEKKDEENIELIVAVKDTGMGIAKEDIDKLFKNFQRLDQRKNRTIEGTGLGLAIVARLLEQMGGSINVESELGSGSTFTAVIPQKVVGEGTVGDFSARYEEKVNQSGSNYKAKFVAPSVRVLAVDDIRMNLVVVKGLLKKTQVQIDMALSGAEALKLTDENKYDVILMDHMMPEMDGIETLHALKERKNRNFDTPVVALTANAIKGAEEEYKNAGFDNYLSKPVNGGDLESMILYYLPAAKLEKE